MDYGHVMYLTNFIKNDVSGREKQLKEIYGKAVRESGSYQELVELKNSMVFFDNGIGATLCRECDHLLETIYREPEHGPELLERMKSLSGNIRAEEQRSMEALKNPDSDMTGVSVLLKDMERQYGEMLNVQASVLVYMLLITGNRSDLNGLRWNNGNSINVKRDLLEHEIMDRLLTCSSDMLFWKISRIQEGNKLRFCDFRYRLEYISYDAYLDYAGKLKKLNDNLYVDEDAENADTSNVVYVGMGNVISCRAVECIRKLSKSAVVRDEYFGQVSEENVIACKRLSLLTLLEGMADGKLFVVSPAKACALMNQLANGREILNKKRQGLCLFCGKKLPSGLVCQEHFHTHDRVYYE